MLCSFNKTCFFLKKNTKPEEGEWMITPQQETMDEGIFKSFCFLCKCSPSITMGVLVAFNFYFQTKLKEVDKW